MGSHEPQIGDAFTVERGSDRARVVGRVVSTSAIVGPTHGCMLVYLYRGAPDGGREPRRSSAPLSGERAEPRPCLAPLSGERAEPDLRACLLLPPILTLRAPWARGYFVHEGTAPLMPGDYFERHAFRDAQGRLVDEEARPLGAADPGVPVGEWRLYDVDAIEASLRAALGE
jgi:hypothetical protein